MADSDEADVTPAVSSRLVSYRGADGLEIVAYVDEGAETLWNGCFVLLAPRYGETKKNNLQLAYFLAANGFKVLRFDQTNHLGESYGRMENFTLEGAANDIVASVDYIDGLFEPSGIVLVALSLAARCGMRACARDNRITRCVNLVGMVDMDKTLKAIYQRDFFGGLSVGADWRMVDILGFQIDGKHFHDNLVESGMKDLAGTLADAENIEAPLLHLYAENDIWVEREDVEAVIAKCPAGVFETIHGVGHEINENNEAVRFAFDRILEFCGEGLDVSLGEVRSVGKKSLLAQNKIERKRLRAILEFSEEETDFWDRYLGKFGIIERAHYYADYFQQVGEMLGRLNDNDVFLDAGCGNGFYGISLLRSLLREAQRKEGKKLRIFYSGIDLTAGGLAEAYGKHIAELVELNRESLAAACDAAFGYNRIDFDNLGGNGVSPGLPFADGAVDKICCSLVVSYLKEPLHLVKEFRRILRPGGVAVVSSMKPGCDMTVLYHDYLSMDRPDEESNENARKLLSAAGQIKLKQESGVYAFFTREELEALALDAGFETTETCRSFGNQANVLKVVK